MSGWPPETVLWWGSPNTRNVKTAHLGLAQHNQWKDRVLQKAIVFTQNDPPLARLSEALKVCGCEMLLVCSEAQLLESVDRLSPECIVVLSSVSMDPAAIRVAQHVRSISHSCPLVIMTAGISTETVICAMRAGVSDVLEQDAPREKIVATLRTLSGRHPGREEVDADGHNL